MLLRSRTLSSKWWKKPPYSSVSPTTLISYQNPLVATQSKKLRMLVRHVFSNQPPSLKFVSLTFLLLCIDCGWIFAQHFCNRLGPAYLQLKNVLNENDPAHAEVLNDIKRRFREETFTRESIAQVILAHPELVCRFRFVMRLGWTSCLSGWCRSGCCMWTLRWHIILHRMTLRTWCNSRLIALTEFLSYSKHRPTLSYQRLQTVQPLTDSELYNKIRRTVSNKHEVQVLESFLIFNKFASVPCPFFFFLP